MATLLHVDPVSLARTEMGTLLHVDPRDRLAHYIAYFFSFWLIFAHFYSLIWLISTHFGSLLLILAHCYSFEKNSSLTFRPSMPRKRAKFIIRGQIGYHTPLGKNKTKQKQKTRKGCFPRREMILKVLCLLDLSIHGETL